MDVGLSLQTIVAAASVTEAEEEKKALASYLNHLLLHDFAALVQVLYRVDVTEKKVKTALNENPQADAGDLLAELLVQRQKEKAVAKQSLQPKEKPSGEEAW